MPPQLFFTTGIPVCLWFLDRDKRSARERDRTGETLFIDARKMGAKVSRTQIELGQDEVCRIASVYHRWRGQNEWAREPYMDEAGFSKVASTIEVERHRFVLTPGRYVGASDDDDLDVEPFSERDRRLADLLDAHAAEADRLGAVIRDGLRRLELPDADVR